VGADEPGAFASAQPALRTALDDADAAVAMNAAGALAAMGVAEGELAAARRRVLAAGARDYVGFLAARGLAGIDQRPGCCRICSITSWTRSRRRRVTIQPTTSSWPRRHWPGWWRPRTVR